MGFLRRHLTYANVVASLALFLAFGGAAFAATQLPKNSVGTKQLKKGAVTASKISRKTRQQLNGQVGPVGPQGPKGATGAKGAAGAKGATGIQGPKGEAGDGPAFEVFATNKAIPGQIVAQTLPAGAFALSANVSITDATAPSARVSCTITGGGKMEATLGEGESTTLSMSVVRSSSTASAVAVSCEGPPSGVTVTYANMIAAQVRSVARAAG
ncbi:MAG TPA: hypothetical protein VMF55_12215 [Solirubrobacterales bacterium]|nr:hypothetical protein [Solirubrobacterales bacterium]